MKRALDHVNRRLGRITLLMSAMGTLAILFMMVITVADVCGRAFFHFTIRGSHELIEFTLVLAVFFALPYVQHKRTNISIGVLTDQFPKKAQALAEAVTCLFSLAIVGVMAWEGFGYFCRLWEMGKETTVLALPVAPFEFVVAYGLLVLFIVIVLEFLDAVTRGKQEWKRPQSD